MPRPIAIPVTGDADRAEAALRAGGLVAIPTETVYGLAADAEQPEAVFRIFEVKGRPADHPLIVHLAAADRIDGWVAAITPDLTRLADACWPGPLTVIVERGRRVLDIVTGGRDTVGLRVPSHPLTQAVLDRLDGGLAAPSANRFGHVSPTSAAHVIDDLGTVLDPTRDAVLDGGPCPVGVESTIVDLTVSPPQVLRAGAITGSDIARLLDGPVAPAAGASRASGMLASHYAPRCEVVLAADRPDADRIAAGRAATGRPVDVLDRTDDLVVAARELYADLRDADRRGLATLVVVVPPPHGIGHAIRDRLKKAAAARDGPSRAG